MLFNETQGWQGQSVKRLPTSYGTVRVPKGTSMSE
jgi:hypothetical protein